MNVTIKLFAGARETVGREQVEVALTDNATVGELREAIRTAHPELGGVLAHAMFAVDASYATDETPINAGAEIALIPPVSGG